MVNQQNPDILTGYASLFGFIAFNYQLAKPNRQMSFRLRNLYYPLYHNPPFPNVAAQCFCI
jgi:hypothetical protein